MGNHKEKEKRIPRFGVLDAVIILLVVCLIAGIYFRSNIIEWVANQRNVRDYTITFAVDNIRHTTPNYINLGDTVRLASNEEELGTVIEASDSMSNLALISTPARAVFTDNERGVIEVFYPEESRVDVVGRLQCRGTYSTDGGFYVNGSTHLSAGKTVTVYTELVTMELRVLEIAEAQ